MAHRSDEWLRVRKEWVKENPPNHQGFYVCGICAKPVHFSNMEVDHIDGRLGRNLVDKENLQPSHSKCNRLKGSRKLKPKVSGTEYAFRRTLDL